MKIKIWTLATDTDSGTTSAAFASEAECTERAWGVVDSYANGKNFRAIYTDPSDAWAELGESVGFMDTMTMDCHEVEVPAPTAPAAIYMLMTDGDDGLQTDLFTTEKQRDLAAFEWLAERDDAGRSAAQIAEEFDDDPIAAGETISNGVDYFNINDVLIDLPAPAGVTTEDLEAMLAEERDKCLRRAAGVNAELLAVAHEVQAAFSRLAAKGMSGEPFNSILKQVNAAIASVEKQQVAAKVTIEVSGGVAAITACPPGVDVEIIDHDNLEADLDKAKQKMDSQ